MYSILILHNQSPELPHPSGDPSIYLHNLIKKTRILFLEKIE